MLHPPLPGAEKNYAFFFEKAIDNITRERYDNTRKQNNSSHNEHS